MLFIHDLKGTCTQRILGIVNQKLPKLRPGYALVTFNNYHTTLTILYLLEYIHALHIYYVPPTEGGGHIVFGAVPVGVGVGVGVRVGVRVRVASFLRDIF